jgi:hypothetical protein
MTSAVAPRRADEVIVRRRRAALVEAGIEQDDLRRTLSAKLKSHRRGRKPFARATITNIIAGYFDPTDRAIQRGIVEEIRTRLREDGLKERAAQITMEYLGWPDNKEN